MKIADGELRQILAYDVKLPADTIRELVADSKQSGTTLLHTVLHSRLVDEAPLARAQAKRLGVPFISLGATSIPGKILNQIPRQIAAKYHVICFDQTPTSIKIAMADPRDEQARQAVKSYTNKTVRRYQATTHDLTRAIRGYAQQPVPIHLSTRDLLATILEQAVRNNSRDVHFEPNGKELAVKRRAGRRLQTMSTLPIAKQRALISWCKVQSGSDVGDTERAHHGRFSIMIDGSLHDVMMSTVPVINGEKMVLRLIPPANSIPSLKSIGYGAKDIAYLQNILDDGSGLVIIAGDNNSEISTTLASLTKLATQQPHTTVTSIEEPLTYQISGSTQVEVTHTLPFSDIVGAVIIQNPNVLITSRLGKGEASEQLIDFALSRHLVVSGLYASSLTSAVSALIKLPLAPALVAASLRLIIVQHQIDALCNNCKVSFSPSGPLKKALWEQFSFSGDSRLYRKGTGCDSCHNGHHGTVMATEWLPITQELQQLIATKADSTSIASYIQNHSDFAKQLGRLAANGSISIDEAAGRLTDYR